MKSGAELLAQIASAPCPRPAIWWLGRSGFVLKFKQAILYVDPCLAAPDAPFAPVAVTHAGLILCTHRERLDAEVLLPMLAASPRAKLVLPKALGDAAHALGVDYTRMVTTDNGLRVEYLDDRIYAVPSACEQLDWTPLLGYPHLGFLVRFGAVTIYHAGACVPYEDLESRLRPYNVTVALLPVSGRPGNFEPAEAAQLAGSIGARWVVPFADSQPPIDRFTEHMLGHHPAQPFKVFEQGEMWTFPE